MSVHALIESTGQKSISCDSDALLLVVVELMVAGKVNAMAVVNAAENLLGIITDHDFMRALNQNGGYLGKSIVGDWMTSNVITCSSGTKLTDAIKLMANHRIRHLAIVDGEN
jgi:CBS domain-containing protein